jgi:hypothetical protein
VLRAAVGVHARDAGGQIVEARTAGANVVETRGRTRTGTAGVEELHFAVALVGIRRRITRRQPFELGAAGACNAGVTRGVGAKHGHHAHTARRGTGTRSRVGAGARSRIRARTGSRIRAGARSRVGTGARSRIGPRARSRRCARSASGTRVIRSAGAANQQTSRQEPDRPTLELIPHGARIPP